jgi:hypothetical protein
MHKDFFVVYGAKCLSHKVVHSWVKKNDIFPANDEEVEMEALRWLKQQTKDFYAVGFGALGKRLDKCINVGGGCVQK